MIIPTDIAKHQLERKLARYHSSDAAWTLELYDTILRADCIGQNASLIAADLAYVLAPSLTKKE